MHLYRLKEERIPTFVPIVAASGGVWRKAAISAKNQAKLRRAALLDGR